MNTAIVTEEKQSDTKTVHVLQNDPELNSLILKSLKNEFEVVSLCSYADLVAQAENEMPDLIFMDLNMPNVDGFELLHLLRSHPITCTIPIVCMTDDDSSESRKRIHNLGVMGVFKKPLSVFTLASDLKGLLSTINKTVRSDDGKQQFTIAHNDTEKYKLIHDLIAESRESKETLVVLSWISGEDFIREDEMDLIKSGKLILLEIKPSLIIKFPFIQDMSPLFHDIFSFLDGSHKNYHLIFDELRNILNVYEKERALAKSYAMARMFNSSFEKVSLFNTKPSQQDSALLLHKMARIFAMNQLG